MSRVLALSAWAFLVWATLTLTFTLEQNVFGVAASLAIALALAPFGDVVGPWWLLHPRRLMGLLRLLVDALGRIVLANLRLAKRIWAPSRPLSSGMVIVPTEQSTDAGLTAVALISSVIVDNQIVDVDRRQHALQYHAVAVPEGDAERARAAINGPIERLLRPMGKGEVDA